MRSIALGVGASLLMGTAAAAHPGHGAPAPMWLHYTTEPLHVAPLSVIVFALGAVWRRRARARARIR
jgi:hypothetical protein